MLDQQLTSTKQNHLTQANPLLIITDILRKHSGYKFFAKLDISMQYYMFEFDRECQDLCTIIT
jgi:hypothetical protein